MHSNYHLKKTLSVSICLFCLLVVDMRPVLAGPVEWLAQQYQTNRTFPRIQKSYDLINQGRLPEAKLLLEKVLTIDSDNRETRQQLVALCIRLKDYRCSLHHAEVLRAAGPLQTQDVLSLAQSYMELQRWQQVITLLDETTLSRFDATETAWARRLLSVALIETKQYPRALAILEDIPDPGYHDLYNKAISKKNLQDFSGITQIFEKAYQAARDYEQKQLVTLHLVELSLADNLPDQARATLTRIQQEFPARQWEEKILAASILVDIVRGDVEAVKKEFKQYRKHYEIPEPLLDDWINRSASANHFDLALTLARAQKKTCPKQIKKSILLEKRGDYRQAAEILISCSEAEKKKFYFDRIGTLYNLSGDTDNELQTLRRAVAAYPNDESLARRLLDRLIALNLNQEAIDLISGILKRFPDSEKDLISRQLSLYEVTRQYQAAVILLEKKLAGKKDISSSDPLVRKLITFADYLPDDQRLALYNTILAHLPEPSYVLLNTAINLLVKNKQDQKLLALLERHYPFATFSHVQSQELLILTASTYYKLGNTPKGEKTLAAIDLQHVEDPDLINKICAVYASQDDCRNVLKISRNSFRLHPLAIRPRMYAGNCYVKQGLPGLAVHSLEIVNSQEELLSSGEHRELILSLAYSYAEMDEYEQAFQYFKKHHQLSTDPVSALQSASMALNLNNQEEATIWLARVEAKQLPTSELRGLYFTLQGRIRVGEDKYEEADRFFTKALTEQENGDAWYNWADNRRQMEDLDGTVDGMKKALNFAPDNGVWQAALAYLYKETGEDKQAVPHFEQALKAEPDQLPLYEDLAYTEKRLHHNDKTVELFKAVVDNSPYTILESKEDERKQMKKDFAIRREIAEIDKRFFATFGTSVNFFSDDSNSTTSISPINSSLNTGYGELTAGWQPPGIGYNNGRTLQLITRLLWGMPTGEIVPDQDTLQPAFGVRYKPFADYNMVLSGERFFKGGSQSRDDWFLRMAASLDQGLDWNPVDNNWLYYNAFAEGGYFTDAASGLVNGEVRLGKSFKAALLPAHSALVPYALAGASWNNDNDEHDDSYRVDLGLGMMFWYWCNESKYKAYETKTTLGLELRQSVGGNTDSGTVIMIRLTTGM